MSNERLSNFRVMYSAKTKKPRAVMLRVMILVFGKKSFVTPVWGEEKHLDGTILSRLGMIEPRLGILEPVCKPQLGMYFGELETPPALK